MVRLCVWWCYGDAAVVLLRWNRCRFYYLDANFTAGGGARPPKGREAYLFSVDPATGGTTKQTISGAVDFTTGYAFYPEDGTILLATDAGDRPPPYPLSCWHQHDVHGDHDALPFKVAPSQYCADMRSSLLALLGCVQ